jgi:hypothetical protein
MPGLSNSERAFLLELLRANDDDSPPVRNWAGAVDWQHLLKHVSPDVLPYLHYRVTRHQIAVPPREAQLLLNARRSANVQNLLLRHEFCRIAQSLQSGKIPVIALKGIVLAAAYYPEPSLRPMSDIDILIPPCDKEKADSIVRSLGYEGSMVLPEHPDHRPTLFPGQEIVLPVRHNRSTALVEVHTQLECSAPSVPVPIEYFWKRAVEFRVAENVTAALCPEDFLFHLCSHLARQHLFEKGILPLLDVKCLIAAHDDWNWDRIAQQAVDRRCVTPIYFALLMARQFAGAKVPDAFFAAVPAPADLSALQRVIEEQIWSAGIVPPGRSNLLSRLLARESWRDRLRLVATRAKTASSPETKPRKVLGRTYARVLALGRSAAIVGRDCKRAIRLFRKGQFTPAAIEDGVRRFRNTMVLKANLRKFDP